MRKIMRRLVPTMQRARARSIGLTALRPQQIHARTIFGSGGLPPSRDPAGASDAEVEQTGLFMSRWLRVLAVSYIGYKLYEILSGAGATLRILKLLF